MMQAGTERPRFRQDLFAESIDEQGARYVDVMDPDSGRVFRLYEVEFSIACAMDGERDITGLVKWAQDELGVTPSTHEVEAVITTLGELGYLDMAAASKAAATDVPATSGLAAAGAPPHDTIVDTPALNVPPSQRRPIPVEDRSEGSPKAAAAPGTVSEVSLDLSEHLAVGKEDVQEAVRQSRVMAAVEVPPELAETATPPATPAQASQPERPAERPTPTPTPAPAVRPTPMPTPAAASQPERPAVRAPSPAPQPERPVEVRQPERPVEVKQSERPVERPIQASPPTSQKPPVTLPKAPEKQPVVPPAPTRRTGLVLIVLLVLVALGIGAFFVWKLVIDKPDTQATGTTPAPVQPVQPAPPPPGPPPKKTTAATIEMTTGRPKTILAYFGGTIAWIETAGKEVKSNDLIVKMQGYKALEDQVATLTKELAKLQADARAANEALAAIAPDDEAARRKAQTKVETVERARDAKSEQLVKKTDQLEPYYVRLTLDGTLTAVLRKVGDKVPDNTPVAEILPAPAPSATFKIPPSLKIEIGTVMALRSGEKILTCEVADWEPEKIRFACPEDPNAVAGTPVTFELP